MKGNTHWEESLVLSCRSSDQLLEDVSDAPAQLEGPGERALATGKKGDEGISRDFLPWKVVHWQVENGSTEIVPEKGVGGVFLIFWCKEIPLGQVAVPASTLPLSKEQFAFLASKTVAPAVEYHLFNTGYEIWSPVPKEERPPRPLPELSRRLAVDRPVGLLSGRKTSTRAADVSVSLIICTRNRPGYLKRCLSSVTALSPKPNEVIVVDNDPSSGLTRPVVERFPDIHYVAEPRAGLSSARNTGLQQCHGEVIAFTDDDAVVHPGWIGAVLDAFMERDVMAVTGLVLPAEIETPAQYVFQTGSLGCEWGFCGLDFGKDFFLSTLSRGVPVWRIGAGANMAFRREAFAAVGTFDARLGAGTSGCSEDSELWYRLLSENYRCRYEPAAVVFHSHRREWSGLRDQAYHYMRGHVAALLFQFDKYRHWGNVHRAALALPWEYTKLATVAARHKIGALLYKSGTDVPACPVAPQIRGVLAGWLYYLKNRRTRR